MISVPIAYEADIYSPPHAQEKGKSYPFGSKEDEKKYILVDWLLFKWFFMVVVYVFF